MAAKKGVKKSSKTETIVEDTAFAANSTDIPDATEVVQPDEPVIDDADSSTVAPTSVEETIVPSIESESTDETTAQEAIVNDSPVVTASEPPKVSKKRPKWFFGMVAGAFVLLIAGGMYAYLGVYAQSAENLWKSSLKNTRDGLKTFADKGPSSKKGLKVDGNIKLSLPIPAELSLTGSTYESSSDMKFDIGVSGIRANLAVRTIPSVKSNTPDIYLNLSGVKNVAGLITKDPQFVAIINSIDSKWLMVDHTLTDQLLSNVSSSSNDITSESLDQIKADVHDIEKKMAVVINDRLLSDDPLKAVLVIKDKLEKEDYKGRKSQRVRVSVQKQQMHDFVVAMKDALKDTKLNQWLVADGSKKTFEEVIGFNDMLKKIDAKNYDSMPADVWIDAGYRTIRNVRIYDSPSDTKNYIELFFDYKGDETYPFTFSTVSDNSSGTQNISIGATIDNKTEAMTLAVTGIGKNTKGTRIIDVTADFALTPTNDKLDVDKPADATNIVNILGGLIGQLQGVQNQLKVLSPSTGTLDTSNL